MRIAKWAGISLLLLALMHPGAPAEIIPGQTDDFNEADNLAGWGGGVDLTRVPSGGPDGSGYLQIGPGVPGRVGAKNGDQWAGDYATNGITGIAMEVKNDGPETIALRLLVSGGSDQYAAAEALALSAGSGWQRHVFGLSAEDLTPVRGTGSLSDVLGAVDLLLLHHDPDPPSPTGGASPPLNATIGIDNITAVPEPTAVVLLAFGGLWLATFAGRRRAAR